MRERDHACTLARGGRHGPPMKPAASRVGPYFTDGQEIGLKASFIIQVYE